jgi:hypothetical protein
MQTSRVPLAMLALALVCVTASLVAETQSGAKTATVTFTIEGMT